MAKIKRGKPQYKQKLSWIYRKKKREKCKEANSDGTNNTLSAEKAARIIVRNLPFKVTEDDVRNIYKSFGQIEEINLLRRVDNTLMGCGFIQFKREVDASKAIFNTNKKEFLGRVLLCDWAIPQSKFCQKIETINATNEKDQGDNDSVSQKEPSKNTKHTTNTEQSNALKKERRKITKLKNRKKRARIVVRNISFQTTVESLKKHFSHYGNVEDVNILIKPDGTQVGCGFVQFEHVQNAAKAIHYANLQLFDGRLIVVDWAIPKNKFCKDTEENQAEDCLEIKPEMKEEVEDANNIENYVNVDIENDESSQNLSSNINHDDSTYKVDSSIGNDLNDEIKIESITHDDIESEGELTDKDIDKLDKVKKEESIADKPKRVSNDITEGKTVFLKNVPFSATNAELKTCMEQYGPVYYALICMDPLTEHSKGTAFVKFKNVQDAEQCLLAGTELRLCDQILDVYKALSRSDVENKNNSKQQKQRDTRNLYLIKEGVIIAGSPAAVGVSSTDMTKRLQLEQWKTQMLRNLNMFISKVRLIIHNLPPSFDDAKLRQLFNKFSGPKAIIKEAKVMRDLKNVDGAGIGKSKEYGFVSFTSHEDALKAVRSINNNPDIFTTHKRPIVAFSIENRAMIIAKQKRMEKSRECNPLWSKSQAKMQTENLQNKSSKHSTVQAAGESTSFIGVASKPGSNKFRSKFNLKSQAVLHGRIVKKEKKKSMEMKTLLTRKKERLKAKREIKPKQGAKSNADEVNFNKIVHKYKNKINAKDRTKSKWFEST